MDLLEEQLSYKFRNPELLQQALTHTTLQTPTTSPFNSCKRTCDHLKLLGDSVIKLLTSQYAICVSPPNDRLHKIVRIKDNLSNRYCQNLVGIALKLEGVVVTNLQQDQISGQVDVFVKSIFGAIFLDAGGSQKKGFVSCWKVFLKLWKPVISSYDGAKPLIACFPEPKYSSQEFLRERFTNFKNVDLAALEEKIGFKFLKQPYLLEQALTHDSIDMFRNAVDHPDPACPEFVHFQTLEFLGDSVLELVIMEYLYLRSSSADPLGQMLFFSKDTSQKLVSSRFQIQVAKKLKIENFVIKPPQVGLASYDDFVESLIGSIYIHGKAIGLRACAKIVLEMWGLEPSLEEEQTEKGNDKQPSPSLSKKDAVANKENIQQTTSKAAAPPPSTPSTSAKVVASKPRVATSNPSSPAATTLTPQKHLQSILDYNFGNPQLLNYLPAKIDVTTTEARITAMNVVNVSKNLQVIGKRAINLLVVEYVVGICHSSETADLSAKTKEQFHKLTQYLSGDELLSDIFTRFHLSKFFNIEEQKIPNPTTSPSDVLHLIFGAVFIDSAGNLDKVGKLFTKLWRNYIYGAKPEACIINCFPDTSEKQKIFRAAVNAKISDTMWIKMNTLLGHTFIHKNLLEQALTDEKSQGYAKQCHNAYPLGNPFGMQVLGRSVLNLFFAQRCYLNTLSEPGNFPGVLERMDQILYNTLKSRFHNFERYYANHIRYPYPPKKNPMAPFEAMFAALYLDVGGGVKGMQQVYAAFQKGTPTLLTMKKGKGVQPVIIPGGSEDAAGRSDTPVSVSTDGGKPCEEGKVSVSECSDSPSNPPLKYSKNVQEELNTSFGSQELASGRSSAFSVPMSMADDPLLGELQAKLAYKFVNPLLLKIVLEVDIPIIGGAGSPSSSRISSKSHFEILKILGKRALNLLVTEFALESLPMSKNVDITDVGKKQLELHRVHLSSPLVMEMIASSLELQKYIFKNADNSTPSNEEFITALLGAVFIDSRANYLKIATLFNKLWKSSINPTQPQSFLTRCFPITTEAQNKLRTATGSIVHDVGWKKFYQKLGYSFKNKNLLEQALTDEASQELARLKHNAFPTGNPFALRLLGRCVVELVIAYKTLPESLNSPQVTNYANNLVSIETGLFNSFKNNFLGTHKYYACINLTKTQQFRFPPKNNPLGPYEAVMGAVFIDAGAGNPGLDTVGIVLIHRHIGISGKLSNIALLDAAPAPAVVSPVPPASVSCTPPPTTSTALSDSLNSSFSSKCAANFSISPALLKKPSPKSVTPVPLRSALDSDTASVSSQVTSVPSVSASPQKSPKKPQTPKSSYRSVLINGQKVETDNQLVIAVTNAQSEIQALKKKQENIDHYRKLSLEKAQTEQPEQDQVSNASSATRSRCPSTSTITSVTSQPTVLGSPAAQKQKKGGKGKRKQNKNPAKHVAPPPKVVVTPQQQQNAQRVSNWCQNQLDRLPLPPSSSSTTPASASSSCTSDVYLQRSTVHQQNDSGINMREGDDSEEASSHFSSAATLTPTTTHVPVNMVCGYRKSAVGDNGYGTSKASFGKDKKTKEETRESTSSAGREDPTGSSGGLLTVLKWTSIILGVAFLLKRYTQGK